MIKNTVLFCILMLFISVQLLAQSIFVITPTFVQAGKPTQITIRGMNTHFQRGDVSAISFTSGHAPTSSITLKKFEVVNTVTAIATVIATNPGSYELTIKTRGEQEVSADFTVMGTTATKISADIEVLPMDGISLKDIDLQNPKATPVLFFTRIYNNDTPRLVDVEVNVLNGHMIRLGTLKYNNGGRGVQLQINGIYSFTNREFDKIVTNGDIGDHFLTQVELTGAFPPDNYTYRLNIFDHNGAGLLTSAQTTAVLLNTTTNPSLITPGAAFEENPAPEYNPLPLFQWFGQNDKYDFAIYECRPGQSPTEATRNIAVYKQNDVFANSFLYPNSAEKLIDGKVYAWQVNGKVQSANGTKYLPSEVFRFTYTGSQNNTLKSIASIKIEPEEIILAEGQQLQFTATCYDVNNVAIPNVKLTWNVSPNNGTITENGLFKAVKAGTAVAVLVNAGTVTEFATVSIAKPSQSAYVNPYAGFVKKLFGLK